MSRANDDASPFHAGERAVQQQSGVRERADRLGPMFRDFMPDQHRELFEELPWLLVGGLDEAAQPWASVLVGEPGFVRAPDPYTLEVHASLPQGDPLASGLMPGRALGLLGIQLDTRRRNRLNGHVVAAAEGGFVVHVDQSFGNCPKYITRRAPSFLPEHSPPPSAAEGGVLSERALACIAAADTCFIASVSSDRDAPHDTREGADVSHRGGPAGFVQAVREGERTRLYVPDYPGNNAFNTLGNLARFPRAGLLFPHFDSGDVLSLTCDVEILWDGAQRALRFDVRGGRYFPARLPFRWLTLPPRTDGT
ncbi:MAG TPA: pyridoxamine 5'-phosphate oxidase family protein [Polyangiales bacterium]|nr:pyridoxamine 5'-phosphate oxidase family protein [Polyangiales bacterium]